MLSNRRGRHGLDRSGPITGRMLLRMTRTDRLRRGGMSCCVAIESLTEGQAPGHQATVGWVEWPGRYRNLVNGDVRRVGLSGPRLAGSKVNSC